MARTHAVRNGYGHIEYLTDSEIANLRERGEDIDVVDNYRGHPPYAKNPANQAYINETWYEQQKKAEEKRKERQRGRGKQGSGGQKGGWTPSGSKPPDVGVVDGTDHIVSFKTGGPNGDDTLIADGDYSDDPKGFTGKRGDRGHDHHGRWGSQGRGKYTGPNS